MRRTRVIVVVVWFVILLFRCLEFLAFYGVSDFILSKNAGLSPDYSTGVGAIADKLGLAPTTDSDVRKLIPLDMLTDGKEQDVSCPPNTKPIFNNPGTYVSSRHKIPFVIHQTFKSRCVTDDFYQLTLAWKGLGIPYYFHDDAAIERLIHLGFKQIPHLQLVWDHCIIKPVVKTDLWRLLLLYEYGGIYADLDTKPESFHPTTTLRWDDEMYTVPDQVGLPSFHFMASMPRHPLPFLTLQHALRELQFRKDVGFYNPAKITGKS